MSKAIKLENLVRFLGKLDAKYITEIQLQEAIANAGHLKKEIVTSLPDAGGADVNTVYMVLRNPAGEQGDIYDEYMVIGGEWELIGNTAINLNDYLKTADAEDTYLKKSDITYATDAEIDALFD